MAKLIKRNITWMTFVMFSIYYYIYIQETTVNIIWQAWFFQVPMVEKLLNHTLVFGDLVNSFGEHGMLGYNLIALGNALFFKFNTFVDAYIIMGLIILETLILYKAFKESLKDYSASWLDILTFILISFIMFSVTQQVGGGMDTQIRIGILSFLLTAYMVDRVLLERKGFWYMVLIVVMIFVSVDVFGTGYSFAWFPGILLAEFVHYLVKTKRLDSKLVTIGLSLLVSGVVYFYMYSVGAMKDASGSGLVSEVFHVFMYPKTSTMSVLAFLSSSTLGRTVFQDHYIRNQYWMIANGLGVLTIYIYSIKLYISSRMWKKTYLPLALIMYTLGVIFLVIIGRQGMGWDWGTNYWYAVHTKFGLIGALWIIYFSFKTEALGDSSRVSNSFMNFLTEKRYITMAFGVIAVYVLSTLILSNIVDWKRAPYVKQYFEQMVPYALSPSDMPVDKDGNTPLVATLQTTLNGLRVMKKYDLNVYSDISKNASLLKSGSVLDNGKLVSGILGTGWYGQDTGIRWIDKVADITLKTGSKGILTIKGYEPDFLSPNKLRAFDGDKMLFTKAINSGEFSIQEQVPANSIIKLKLRMDKAIIPKDHNINLDERELSAAIIDIDTD